MAQIRTTYRYEADLDKGTREVTLHHPLMQMDALADAFDVAILRSGEAVNVDGMEANGYLFLAGQQATIPLRGSVSGNHAVVVLPSECYATPGYASLTLQLTEGAVRHSVLRVSLCIAQTGSSKVIGGGDMFPSLAEIVEKMNTMDAAATDAHSAAEAARSAIEALNTLFPHEHFSTAQLERVAGTVTNKEYWFFVNARWDEETRRFKRIDIGKNSFGIQMQAAGTYPGEETLGYIDNQGIGYWRAIGRDYFLTHGDTANAAAVSEDIGTMIGDEWREFGVYLGWNNCFMLDSYGGMTIGGAGFEIDGNGIYPYSRLSMCKHEDVPGSVGYAFMGTLWNAYHQLLGSDDEAQCDYAAGFKAPIDYHPGGE
ncbi:MAG: hypothetical protein PUC00_06665 [Clostridiales bacterium]|nr:hypothetical protein [Clostridiales bacterium]